MSKSKPAQSIVVAQYYNPKFDASKPKDPRENPEFNYKVEKLTNTLVESIGYYLTPARVQELIDQGISITIQPVK